MQPSVWDPAQYLRFADERLRPALDLLAQVPLDAPARVVDLGCGAGNVTAILQQRFPQAEVVGVDGSAAMLEKARVTVPLCRFEQADFFQWQPTEPLDLIYSNAALQWVDRHPTLFPRLLSFLAPGGVLAVQMPAMHDTPLRLIPYDMAAKQPWAEYLSDVSSAPAILSPAEYWDLLRPHVASLDYVADDVYARAQRRERRGGMGVGQQPAAVPGSAAGGAEGSVPPGVRRRRAAALSSRRRRHDAAAVPTAVHGGAQRPLIHIAELTEIEAAPSVPDAGSRQLAAESGPPVGCKAEYPQPPAASPRANRFSDPAASTTVARRSRCRSSRCIRRFQPSGMRRDRGFQAVTSVALRAPRRRNSASGTRRPMTISYPPARYRVRR